MIANLEKIFFCFYVTSNGGIIFIELEKNV